MSVLSDKWIKKWQRSKQIITPFVPKQTRKRKISYGLSSYGYDARVSNDFKIFTNVNPTIVDPKNFQTRWFYIEKIKYLCNTTKLFCFSKNSRIFQNT